MTRNVGITALLGFECSYGSCPERARRIAELTSAERLAYGGDGPRTTLLCGGFALAPGLPENLLSLLPVMLVLDTTSTGMGRWLEPAFGLLRDEIAREAPGASAVLAKLADVQSC